jgi:aldehyde:ferredoxin oxidoreductase
VGKSPLTGGWGDANCGGKFGPTLKFAGYDGVFVVGMSQEPVYLLVDEGHAELRPAGHLWGLDALETEQVLQERHGGDTQVACIGPAGERLALISCIMTDRGRAAGRSGLGAVMGSKRLKAVVARGSTKPTVAYPEKVAELRNRYLPEIRKGLGEAMHNEGTAGSTAQLIEIGRTPIKNWGGAYPDDFSDTAAINGPALSPLEIHKYGCWGCSVACGAIVRWESGGQVYEGHRPEYETLGACGTYCGIDDLTAILDLNEMCNRAGLDTISAGACIAFAMECYDKGVLSRTDLDGLELNWGDGQAATELLARIAGRAGIGDLLADGVWRASQKLGKGSEAFAVHAGGQELPAHDPRQLPELGLQYQLSPTPGRHTQGGGWVGEMPPEALEPFGLDPGLRSRDPLGFTANGYRAHLAWNNVLNACGVCSFGGDILGPGYIPEFIAAVTGWDYDMEECLETGERIEVVRHLFGLRQGCNPLAVRVPPRVMGDPPLATGPTAGVTVDMTDLRDAYLKLMEWDAETAMPSSYRLEALGLSDLIGVRD